MTTGVLTQRQSGYDLEPVTATPRFVSVPGEAVRHAEVASSCACLASLYGETGLPMSQTPPPGLAGRVQRKGKASTVRTRSTAGVASH